MSWVLAGVGIAGIAAGGAGTISSIMSGNRAKKANKRRMRQIYNLLQISGEASKADITESFKGERGGIQQSAIGRGIFNSSVLDGLTNQSLGREARAKANVDENVAQQKADFLNSVTETSDPNAAQNFAQLGLQSAQLLAGSLMQPQAPSKAPTREGNRIFNMFNPRESPTYSSRGASGYGAMQGGVPDVARSQNFNWNAARPPRRGGNMFSGLVRRPPRIPGYGW